MFLHIIMVLMMRHALTRTSSGMFPAVTGCFRGLQISCSVARATQPRLIRPQSLHTSHVWIPRLSALQHLTHTRVTVNSSLLLLKGSAHLCLLWPYSSMLLRLPGSPGYMHRYRLIFGSPRVISRGHKILKQKPVLKKNLKLKYLLQGKILPCLKIIEKTFLQSLLQIQVNFLIPIPLGTLQTRKVKWL